MSEEHFTVDGTLQQAWASRRSFKPKLLRDTHESTTDAEARLYRKAQKASIKQS